MRMAASNPHFAASKARRGKGEVVNVDEALVMPVSAATEVTDEGPKVIAGQMAWSDDGSSIVVIRT